MKVVIIHGFNSSGDYIHSERIRELPSDADIIIGVSEGERPILIKAPEDFEIVMVQGRHMQRPAVLPSMTPQEWQDEIDREHTNWKAGGRRP